MTRAEGEQRREYLQNRIQELENQLLAVDASSATLSSGGGSKSYTNLWNAAKGLFLPRAVSGAWMEPDRKAYTETVPETARTESSLYQTPVAES